MIEPLPDDRLKGETPLRQAQLVMLRLLRAFHGICEERGWRYWLDAGTLLGAVRHGGFIPWDDDVDVIMPREDYLAFCAAAPALLPYDMFFQSPESDPGFSCPWIKIRDRYSHLVERSGPYPYSQAIFIDVFPAVLETEAQHRNRAFYSLLEPLRKRPEPLSPDLPLKSNAKRALVGAAQYAFIGAMKVPALKRRFLKRMSSGMSAWAYEPPIRWLNSFPDEVLFPLKKIGFEGHEFWGPADPHRYLADYFGDYMSLPPPEKRIGDHGVDEILPIGPNPHFSGLKWEDYHR
jgi:lipopolysaccharide cholinephosphotransferase